MWKIIFDFTGAVVGKGTSLRAAVMSVDGCAPISGTDFTTASDEDIRRFLAANGFSAERE